MTEFHADGTSIRDLLCQLPGQRSTGGMRSSARMAPSDEMISASSFCDNGQLVQAFATIDLAEQTAASEVHRAGSVNASART